MLSRNLKNIYSYGTGRSVKLPGKTIDTANIYPFGTPYQAILEDLESKDKK